jgi:hypothetical protein
MKSGKSEDLTDDSLHRLLQRLEGNLLDLFDDDGQAEFPSIWEAFREAGYLRPTEAASAAKCRDCDAERHAVTKADGRSNGEPKYYVACPSCGPCEIPIERLHRSSISTPNLVTAITQAAGIQNKPTEVIPHVLWRMGLIASAVQSKEAYLAIERCLVRGDEISTLLTRRRRAILFFPTPRGCSLWNRAVPDLILPLSDYLTFENGSIQFDRPRLATAIRADRAESTPKRKPAKKRGDRAANIESLIDALVDQLLAARDHALDTEAREGVPRLLPRPSRKDLGKLAGVKEWTVSKCFDDSGEPARLLNLLWKTALDVEQVKKFTRPTRT